MTHVAPAVANQANARVAVAAQNAAAALAAAKHRHSDCEKQRDALSSAGGAFSVVNFLGEYIVNRLGGRTFYTFYVCAGSALASKHEQLRHVIIPPVAQKQQNGL
jgi:hypothetical protein